MQVNAASGQSHSPKSKKEIEQDEVRKKLAEKFGDKFKDKKEIKKEKEDSVELSNSTKKQAHIDPEGFGDVKKNDPKSEETQEKLKALLKTGAFHFSDKERQALGEILK